MKKELRKEKYGLCFRCEHRAQFLHDKLNAPAGTEFVQRPRYECGMESSVHSCYMYRPVRPYILKPNEGERRGLTLPWMFSGRAHAVGIANVEYAARKIKKGLVFFCQLIDKVVK